MLNAISKESFYAIIALIHGLTGLIIFISGILQFTLRKGGVYHKITGQIYNYSWIIILISGAYIGSPIVVAIVLMGFYLSLTGVRIAVLKNKPYALIDKIILGIAVLIVLFMFYSAIHLAILQYFTFAIIAAFFSILYGFILILDISWFLYGRKIIGKQENYGNHAWYVNHMMRMQFSFITAIGAFTGVQNIFGNPALNFILPAFIGFVVIRFSKKYFLKKGNILSN